MMLCCDKQNDGFSLLEVLVVLSILSLTIAAFVTSNTGPSPAMRLEARASDLRAEIGEKRIMAITQGTLKVVAVNAPLCNDSAETLTFFPNGTALPATVCLSFQNLERELVLDPLTAQLRTIDEP